MSARQQALTALRNRLAGITVAGGYQTDVGLHLYIGEEPVLGPGDAAAAVAVMVQEDTPGYQGEKVVVVLPVKVQAIVAAGADAWAALEAVIADVKKAVETDHDLGGTLLRRGLERGTTAPLDRKDGSEYAGAEVTYVLNYAEQWGAP